VDLANSSEPEVVVSKVSTGTILAKDQANRVAFAKEATVVSNNH